ncbi:hypothetical protein MP228_011540 [Amoeboaphelidium protococcarum]|nr:hypothetical protein MP228_011540 [Amoeboaphelidium protococcarum]
MFAVSLQRQAGGPQKLESRRPQYKVNEPYPYTNNEKEKVLTGLIAQPQVNYQTTREPQDDKYDKQSRSFFKIKGEIERVAQAQENLGYVYPYKSVVGIPKATPQMQQVKFVQKQNSPLTQRFSQFDRFYKSSALSALEDPLGPDLISQFNIQAIKPHDRVDVKRVMTRKSKPAPIQTGQSFSQPPSQGSSSGAGTPPFQTPTKDKSYSSVAQSPPKKKDPTRNITFGRGGP